MTARNTKHLRYVTKLRIFVLSVAILKVTYATFFLFGNAWLGADGENYLKIVIIFEKEGFLARDFLANYFPTGYSHLIYLIGKISRELNILLLVLGQTTLFAIAVLKFERMLRYFLSEKLSAAITLFLSLNPTLSLSSLVIGYESVLASCIMLFCYFLNESLYKRNSNANTFLCGLSGGLAIYVHPAVLPIILAMPCLVLFRPNYREYRRFILLGLIVLLFPIISLSRNYASTNEISFGSSLGTTMLIGAGPNSSGTYLKNDQGLECKTKASNEIRRDRERVLCALIWYSENPSAFLNLSKKKVIALFSPWYSGISMGTMARNPWLLFHPFKTLASERVRIGYLGNTIRLFTLTVLWTWLFLLIIGSIGLYREFGRVFFVLIVVPIIGIIFLTILTVGDHRFRLPIIPQLTVLTVYTMSKIPQLGARFRK